MNFNEWLQSRLTAHGFAVGPIDGILGSLSKRALLAFQTRHGLPVSGIADDATVKALRAPSSALTPLEMAGMPDRAVIEKPRDNSSSDWPRQSNVKAVFGEVGTRQKIIPVPYAMYLAWDRNSVVRRMSVHELIANAVSLSLEEIADTYTEGERARIGADIFGGSLNVRRMRGGTSYSMHAWGIALDFDPERNQLRWGKDKARLAQDDAVPFWDAWEKRGFVSLGRARNFDWMHVQAARL